MDKSSIKNLKKIANQVRQDILTITHSAGSGHPGGAMGMADVLTYLYFEQMNIDPENPAMEERDRFVLSPAHQVPGLYAVLCARGYFGREHLETSREYGSLLQGHAFRNLDIGVETTGGSLGQGLSIACGFALESKFRERNIGSSKKPTYNTYCIVSDGEMNEGQTWEAIMFAAKEKLNNLIMIVDDNGIQLSEDTKEIMPLYPLAQKLINFDWQVMEVDGHDFDQLKFALDKAIMVHNKPVAIVAKTTPGKGVSYMKNKWQWHGKSPNDEEYEQGINELKQALGENDNE